MTAMDADGPQATLREIVAPVLVGARVDGAGPA